MLFTNQAFREGILLLQVYISSNSEIPTLHQLAAHLHEAIAVGQLKIPLCVLLTATALCTSAPIRLDCLAFLEKGVPRVIFLPRDY